MREKGAPQSPVNYATGRLDAASGAMAAYLAYLILPPLSLSLLPSPLPRSSGASRRTCCPFSSSVVSVSSLRGTLSCAARPRATSPSRSGERFRWSRAENAAETRAARA